VVTALGFQETGSFQASSDGRDYHILVRPETVAGHAIAAGGAS
jgi:hypothetical protein